jgi:hypothetical protein
MNKEVRELGDNDVQFYSQHARDLKHTQRNKVLKFIENKCVEYDSTIKQFIVRHIEGYNTRDYHVSKEHGDWTCDCQFYMMGKKIGEHRVCSHAGAVLEHLARYQKGRREEKINAGMQMTFGMIGF